MATRRAMSQTDERAIDVRAVLPLAIGLAGLAAGTALGWDSRLVEALISPPAIIRAILVGTAVVVGLWLLRASVRRLRESPIREGAPATDQDVAGMVRGIRLTFLAVAALAAGSGWLLGHPLPLVLALVIAAIDVIETSFLLVVVTFRSKR